MKYKVIYLDPPWNFQTRSPKGLGRSAQAHYDCMSMEELEALAPQIMELADPELCAMCMWVTDPLLPQALSLIKTFGFVYKTVLFTWVKLNPVAAEENIDAARGTIVARVSASLPLQGKNAFHMGTGYYTRANPEMCLLATRGKRAPKTQDRGVRQLLVAPRGQHSQKPAEARRRIERLFSGPYYELFARSTAPGWSCDGNQVGLLDNGKVDTRRWPSAGPGVGTATCSQSTE